MRPKCDRCNSKAHYLIMLTASKQKISVCKRCYESYCTFANMLHVMKPMRIKVYFSYNWLWYGIKGLLRYILRMGMNQNDYEIKRRRLKCYACTYYKRWRCKICGCFIPAKTAISTEECPMGYW